MNSLNILEIVPNKDERDKLVHWVSTLKVNYFPPLKSGNSTHMSQFVNVLAKIISESITVPTIGIGASKHCDGQILVTDDLLGLSNFTPRFIIKYSNLKKIINKSVLRFRHDVINKNFPSKKNIY